MSLSDRRIAQDMPQPEQAEQALNSHARRPLAAKLLGDTLIHRYTVQKYS